MTAGNPLDDTEQEVIDALTIGFLIDTHELWRGSLAPNFILYAQGIGSSLRRVGGLSLETGMYWIQVGLALPYWLNCCY